jgi:hypothetical protein
VTVEHSFSLPAVNLLPQHPAVPLIDLAIRDEKRWEVEASGVQFPVRKVEEYVKHCSVSLRLRPKRLVSSITIPSKGFERFCASSGALLLARNGVTVRPLSEPSLNIKTCLVCRADDDSKIASEFVRAFMRKMPDRRKHQQLSLPISA